MQVSRRNLNQGIHYLSLSLPLLVCVRPELSGSSHLTPHISHLTPHTSHFTLDKHKQRQLETEMTNQIIEKWESLSSATSHADCDK